MLALVSLMAPVRYSDSIVSYYGCACCVFPAETGAHSDWPFPEEGASRGRWTPRGVAGDHGACWCCDWEEEPTGKNRRYHRARWGWQQN